MEIMLTLMYLSLCGVSGFMTGYTGMQCILYKGRRIPPIIPVMWGIITFGILPFFPKFIG